MSNILGKLLDKVILANHTMALKSSDLQFGFKSESSTTACSFVLDEVVNYYNRNGSDVHTEAHWGHGVFYFSHIFITRPGELVSRPGKILTCPGKILTRLGKIPTRPGEILTRLGKILTRPGEILARPGKILTRPGEIGH